jgi:glyoxylase-like metal-dependent hydrolase (beta-lactamase superfamily II)
MEYRTISIGTLSVHELWTTQGQGRTPHATTTLIQTSERNILVDPGLPEQALTARLQERSGLNASSITDVFLTNFRPAHRMGLAAFANASWLISETERETIGHHLVEQYQQADDEQTAETLKQDIALLKRCEAAPQTLIEGVDIFPSAGFTPGTCGLLLSFTQTTVLIAGDAVATYEHLRQGRVLKGAWDAEQAKESFKEAIEIADVIVPGHDELLLNPTKSYF